MQKLFSIIVYAASVLISWKYCAGYWVVGPVFGAALLLVNKASVGRSAWKAPALAAASTLIYALVFWIAQKGWRFSQQWLDMLGGSLTTGVIAGSILLPSLHAVLFGLNLKNVRGVILSLIASWYAVTIFSIAREKIGISLPINDGLIAIALWQGIYLWKMKLK